MTISTTTTLEISTATGRSTNTMSSPIPRLLLPSPKDLLLTFLLSLPIIFVLRLSLRRPLPKEWPLLGVLASALYNLHRIHDFTVDLLRHSGATTFASGPWLLTSDILLTADPANVHHIFTSNFRNYPKGPDFAEIFDVLGNGIFNSDHDSWRLQRRLAHSFMARHAFRALVGETSTLKVHHGILAMLSRASQDGTTIDLQDVFLRFTFDATCVLVMGVDPGCLSLDPKPSLVPFAKAMDDVEEVVLLRHLRPMCCWKLLRWLRVGEERRLRTARAEIEEYIRAEVTKRTVEICNSKEDHFKASEVISSADLLSSYLRLDSDSDSEYLDTNSFEFLRDTMVNLLLAGRDTTASGLAWFFYLVSTHPRVREGILSELRGARRTVGPDGFAMFEVESLLPLVYLHAVLLETLRLYPPVPFEHKRAVEEDALPSGHRVAKGMEVFVSLYAMARMEGVWGADCEEFKPERWMNEKGKLRYEPSYKFMSFNSGPRTCLGKDMALTQMRVVAAAVLWNFEVEVVEAKLVRPKASIILHMREGLKVRVGRREGASAERGEHNN